MSVFDIVILSSYHLFDYICYIVFVLCFTSQHFLYILFFDISFVVFVVYFFFFFFKQKTAYEMRISDWSSDVCSSDLIAGVSPTSASLSGSATDSGSRCVSPASASRCASTRRASATASSRSKGLDRNSCAPPRNAPAVLATSV